MDMVRHEGGLVATTLTGCDFHEFDEAFGRHAAPVALLGMRRAELGPCGIHFALTISEKALGELFGADLVELTCWTLVELGVVRGTESSLRSRPDALWA